MSAERTLLSAREPEADEPPQARVPASERIRQRLTAEHRRFHANDNISACIR